MVYFDSKQRSDGFDGPIDVWILGGYLGAGKTTTLNMLLFEPRSVGQNPALIINEFGRIGVDGALVQRQELRRFEINKGSLFCICTKTDFLKALADIAEGDHQVVYIEATGIAEPVDIEQFLAEGPHAGRFRLRGNLCIVDAENFTKVAAFLKPAISQVRWADAIVINKCDRVDDAERQVLEKVLAELNPEVPRCWTSFGRVEAEFLNRIERRRRDESLKECPPSTIAAVSLTAEVPLERASFFAVLERLGEHILRLKGNVAFEDGAAFVEMVCGRIRVKQPLDLLSSRAGATAFTVIVHHIEKQAVIEAFAPCGCVPCR
ncbi:MAG: hypothetical protein GX298_02480 [Planctomycetes bacterium]|nr:hypothetical protein [Planctomycetota bacterium]